VRARQARLNDQATARSQLQCEARLRAVQRVQTAFEVGKTHATFIRKTLQISIILNLDLQPAYAARDAYCDVRQRAASSDDMTEAVLQQRLKSKCWDAAVLCSDIDFP
jgi:hypothetical protein